MKHLQVAAVAPRRIPSASSMGRIDARASESLESQYVASEYRELVDRRRTLDLDDALSVEAFNSAVDSYVFLSGRLRALASEVPPDALPNRSRGLEESNDLTNENARPGSALKQADGTQPVNAVLSGRISPDIGRRSGRRGSTGMPSNLQREREDLLDAPFHSRKDSVTVYSQPSVSDGPVVGSLPAVGVTRVSGYTRSNGTYVEPHYRTSADGTLSNNWSHSGNINPYTGAMGHSYR